MDCLNMPQTNHINIDTALAKIALLAESLPAKKKPINYKVGQELYSLSIDDDGKCELDTYKISRINKNGYYLIMFTDYTWGNRAAIGKTSSKTKDYGWLPNIPSWCKYHSRTWEGLKDHYHFHTTKRAAWADPYNLENLMWDDTPEDAAIKKRVERSIKAALTRFKNAKTK